MAKTPRELHSEARRRVTMRPDPDTLDANEQKSGSAVSTPKQPRGDFDRQMTGTAQDKDSPNTAVSENVSQDTGGVRPKTRGRRYEVR